MEYLKPKFTLPAGPKNVTQEEWDRIFKDVKVSEKQPTFSDDDSTCPGNIGGPFACICKIIPGPALRTSKKS